MSMSEEELFEIAQRIAQWHMEDAEYCLVYEDDEVIDNDLSDDEMKKIHKMVISSTVVLGEG